MEKDISKFTLKEILDLVPKEDMSDVYFLIKHAIAKFVSIPGGAEVDGPQISSTMEVPPELQETANKVIENIHELLTPSLVKELDEYRCIYELYFKEHSQEQFEKPAAAYILIYLALQTSLQNLGRLKEKLGENLYHKAYRNLLHHHEGEPGFGKTQKRVDHFKAAMEIPNIY